MTPSAPNAMLDVKGEQRPRISCIPPAVNSTGREAIDLARLAGLVLDPWEEYVLAESLGEDERGRWAAFEVGLVVARQNGKGSILEARELAGLYLLNERLIIHSAHEFATSEEHFRRVKDLIEGTPEFSSRVKKNGIKQSHGQEGIELVGGNRIKFRTRTKGGARGFTGDLVVFDEAMYIQSAAHGAILPTLSAKSITGNPQVWYTASAVDQWIHDHGVVLARIRERALAGADPSLAYFEWSVDCDDPDDMTEERALDPQEWAKANPGLGIRISGDHVGLEQRAMDARTFAVERLGVGDWPSTSALGEEILDQLLWKRQADAASAMESTPQLAFDVTPDRSYGSIGLAGIREDGKKHLELVARDRGTGWMIDRLVELAEEYGCREPICDGAGPAGSLIPKLEKHGIEPKVLTAKEHAQACGAFFDEFEEDQLRHVPSEALDAAAKGAAKRSLGEAWAWSRKSAAVDISPLVVITIANWGVATEGPSAPLFAFR